MVPQVVVWMTLLLLVAGGQAVAQQSHPPIHRAFTCPQGQFIKSWNPTTRGDPGFRCELPPTRYGNFSGTGNCLQSITVVNGIITAATFGTCS